MRRKAGGRARRDRVLVIFWILSSMQLASVLQDMDQTADTIVTTGGAMTGLTAIRDNLGIHATSLTLREQRSAMLASTIAHAATPGYMARDLVCAPVSAEKSDAGFLR